MAVYGAAVGVRIHERNVVWFAHIGRQFLHSAHTSPAIDSIGSAQSASGYDGQFYFFIAADPAHARDYMRHGPDGDQAGKRFARIGYPLVARAAALGRAGAVPYTLLVVNLLALAAGTAALGAWLVRRRRSAWFAALYGLWPGMVFAVFRDLSEPLAYCLAILAVLAFDRRRVWLACALLAAAALTRETVLTFPVALAVALWLDDRRLRRPLLFVLGALGPMVVWRVFVTHWLHATTLDHTGGWKVVLPFYGIASWRPWDGQHWLIALAADLPLLLAAAAGAWLLYRRRVVSPPVLLLLNVALFVVFIPHNVVIDYGAAGRNVVPALLAALYCVPWVRSRLARRAGAFLLSPVWYLIVATAFGIAGIRLVTQ